MLGDYSRGRKGENIVLLKLNGKNYIIRICLILLALI